MNQAEFDKVVASTVESINKLLAVKGGEYAGSEDRLANFKRGATLTGVTPLQCLFIYLSKHYDSVSTYIRDQATGTNRVRSEPITGRLDDIINYCILAKALVQETESAVEASTFKQDTRVSTDLGTFTLSKGDFAYWVGHNLSHWTTLGQKAWLQNNGYLEEK